MNAGLVGKGVAPDDGLVVLNGIAGKPSHQPGRVVELGGVDPQIDSKDILAGLDSHHHLLDRGVARPLTDAVDRAFDLTGAGRQRSQGVGYRQIRGRCGNAPT